MYKSDSLFDDLHGKLHYINKKLLRKSYRQTQELIEVFIILIIHGWQSQTQIVPL